MKTRLITYVASLMTAAIVGTGQKGFSQTPIANMVLIPAGTFTMGDTFGEGSSDELPLHMVYVSAFYMDKYEVTKALWDEVYQWATSHGYSFNNPGMGKAANHPIHTINWYEAVKWCNARSEKENKTPAYYTDAGLSVRYRTGQVAPYVNWSSGYRLPTEAEWEKAARGGVSGHRFPWADTDNIAHSRANYYSISSYAYDTSPTRGFHPTFAVGGSPYTSPVGYFAPNGYGLYDMAGNVWEWCWDWYGAYTSGSQTDPRGPVSGSYRVIRGGNWGSEAIRCRTADRFFGNPAGSRSDVGFRSVLPFNLPNWTEIPPVQPTYGNCPIREPGKDSLIVVTHGRIQHGDTPEASIAWVDDMTNAISHYLQDNHLNNWRVHAHKWTEKAETVRPWRAINEAEQEGGKLGDCISAQGWSHVHLIGYSAGSALIQVVSEKIKAVPSATTVVHTTFLDAYTRVFHNDRSRYGNGADWANSYFSRDSETGSFTQGPLDHAYNVDVTWLDPSKERLDTYSSSDGLSVEPCLITTTTHGWPIRFYTNTIPPMPPDLEPGYAGFGFPLSKEGGNWDYATSHYPVGKNMLSTLGTPDPPCVIFRNETTQPFADPAMNFTAIPSRTSGTIQINGQEIMLLAPGIQFAPRGDVKSASAQSASSAWLATFVTITNAVNFVSFEAVFTSGMGAEGLLSVYWDTNTIGSIDERVVLPGLRQYSFMFPKAESNSLHVLGFRLDSFTNVASSVTVTNVALGFAGPREPFSLAVTDARTNGLAVLQLTGPSGFDYLVEASSNLIDWTTFAVLVNTNGIVRFVDTASTNAPARFYRAVAP